MTPSARVARRIAKGEPELTTRISAFDLTLIWTETVSELVSAAPPDGPLGFVGNDVRYSALIERIRLRLGENDGLALPWRTPSGNRFWTFYLGAQVPGDVSGRTAAAAIVPLREEVDVDRDSDLRCRVQAELFYFPIGLALVVTAGSRRPLTPEQVEALARTIRFEPKYRAPLLGKAKRSHTAAAIANAVLSRARRQRFGSVTSSGRRGVEPFTVLTVLEGSTPERAPIPTAMSDIHRMLDAVTSWQTAAKTADPLDRVVHKDRNPDGILVYGAGTSARAVWSPTWFHPQQAPTHKLGCYHRNLVCASMQVETLGAFVKHTAAMLPDALPERHKIAAKRAVIMLRRLYTGEDCYKSWSARQQIADRGYLDALNRTSKEFGLPDLN